MYGFTSELRPAHKIMQDDWFKLGSRLCRVLDSYPQGELEQVIKYYFVHENGNRGVVGTLVVPSAIELKTYNQCVLPKISHKDCPVCGRKK